MMRQAYEMRYDGFGLHGEGAGGGFFIFYHLERHERIKRVIGHHADCLKEPTRLGTT